MSSVSVSERSVYPLRCSSARSAAKFSTMPLCTTASEPSSEMCGCALASLGGPCVAQRVCAMPIVPAEFSSEHADVRLDTLPVRLTTEMRWPLPALARRRLTPRTPPLVALSADGSA